MFQVKDAREKLVQRDARFKIRGGGAMHGGGSMMHGGAAAMHGGGSMMHGGGSMMQGGGAAAMHGGGSMMPGGGGGGAVVHDARQMLNSRKQSPFGVSAPSALLTAVPHHLLGSASPLGSAPPLLQHIQVHGGGAGGATFRHFNQHNNSGGGAPNLRMSDARDRLSLKRSIAGTGAVAPPLKITKTIQQRPVGMSTGIRSSPQLSSLEAPASKQQINNSILMSSRSLPVGSASSFMSTPITKVVKNDSYTAPPPPPLRPLRPAVPVATARPHPNMAARPPSAAPPPVSRTLQQSTESSSAPPPPQPAFSPLEGTKITVNNLHPRVTEEDIVELFCVCGALKRARLVRVGVAEVVFVRKDDAVSAYRKYNNRCLDGQPMKCNLHIQGSVITSDQPILLRLSDSPPGSAPSSSGGAAASKKSSVLPPSLSRPSPRPPSSSSSHQEVDPQTILRALFRSGPAPSGEATPPSSNAPPTAFRIKI